MSGYFADPDVTPEESAAAVDALAAKYGVTEDVAALREAGQNGAMDLASFLRARLDEDEQAARAVDDRSDPWPGQWEFDGYGLRTRNGWSLAWPHSNEARFPPGFGEHVARHDPARVLAEVEAKRLIVDEHGPNEYGLCDVCVLNDDARRAPCPTLRMLALPYAGRPGYREEWKP